MKHRERVLREVHQALSRVKPKTADDRAAAIEAVCCVLGAMYAAHNGTSPNPDEFVELGMAAEKGMHDWLIQRNKFRGN